MKTNTRLQQITEHTFYLPGAVNIGVIATESRGAIAIDTGLNKDAARHLRRGLEEASLTLRAIISTHHHADHIGGNAYLLRNFPDAQVYAPPIEATLIENPMMESIFLNTGATPHSGLRTRWLVAEPSPVHHLISDLPTIAGGTPPPPLQIDGTTLEVVALPGHTIAQVGISYEGVCFATDGYFGPAVLEKYGIPYAHDIAPQIRSLDHLAERDEAWFLCGHGDLLARSELAPVLESNRSSICRSSEVVRQALPGDLAAITASAMQVYGQQSKNGNRPSMVIAQYAVFTSAVNAHLTYLEQQGQAKVEYEEGRLVWSRA